MNELRMIAMPVSQHRPWSSWNCVCDLSKSAWMQTADFWCRTHQPEAVVIYTVEGFSWDPHLNHIHSTFSQY